jgi:hypothetical protein
MQAIPLPHHQVSFQRDGQELARHHFAPDLNRPFVFPILGPSGRSLTRMGHPRDPESHSHHNSFWVSHHDVNGVDFWGDHGPGKGRIRHLRVERFEDGPESAWCEVRQQWVATNTVVLHERRRLTVQHLPSQEWLLILDLELEPPTHPVTLGKTPFGLVGVRLAKTIGVHDGGGTILNSDGLVNEREVFWKAARWVDYSGPITTEKTEGVTLMDHPQNPNHPAVFHVRNDGWMGASLTFEEARTLHPGKPLRLRYGLHIHAGAGRRDRLESVWKSWAELPPAWP